MKKLLPFNLPVVFTLILLSAPAVQAQSQDNPECLGTACGRPRQEGGGCGCGCGCSVWVAYTDDGQTLSYTDDMDGDGVSDSRDNCPTVSNRDQRDNDGDRIGDACDNCPNVYNPDQKRNGNRRGDPRGDACATITPEQCGGRNVGRLDRDGDCVPDDIDNCPDVPNPGQENHGRGTQGDACNRNLCTEAPAFCTTLADTDGDGVPDILDNCPTVYNPDQKDTGNKGKGDACTRGPDDDMDGDGIANKDDNCVGVPNNDQTNTNHKANPAYSYGGVNTGVGDACYAEAPVFYVGQFNSRSVAENGVGLNPQQPWTSTLGGLHKGLLLGKEYALSIWANRNNAAATYSMSVIEAPAGSGSVVQNSRGDVTRTDGRFTYVFPAGKAPTFRPDKEGTYKIQLQTNLAFADRAYPSVTSSTDVATLQVGTDSGSSGGAHTGGCAAVPAGAPVVGVGIALLGILRRRRR